MSTIANRRRAVSSGSLVMLLAALPVAESAAAVLPVGPDGTYPNIQVGIAAALILGGSNEVRVQSGTYFEHISFTQTAGSLTVSGGWDSAFAVRSPDPNATRINGGANGRPLFATVSGGTLDFSNFSLVGGLATDFGGGLRLAVSGSAYVRTHDLSLLLNSVQAAGADVSYGGAVFARVSNDAAWQFDHNAVLNNTATAVPAAYGAGLYVQVLDQGNVIIQQSRFADNAITAAGGGGLFSNAAGVGIEMSGSPQASLVDNVFENNRLNVPAVDAGASGTFVFLDCFDGQTCDLGMHRNRWSGHLGGLSQVDVDLNDTGAATLQAVLSNSLIEGGEGDGLVVAGDIDDGRANVVNFTIADNTGIGLIALRNSAVSNTISYGNANGNSSIQGSVLVATNLLSEFIDPQFADAAAGNYRLRDTSPARDAGTQNPPGGIGLFDLDGAARVNGPLVDIGAYEFSGIFRDGFEGT